MKESEASTILKAEIVHHPECSIFAEALGLAIQALEKQIPKKALNKKDALFANCPNCGRVQNSVWNKTYCGDCGKKLDWSD